MQVHRFKEPDKNNLITPTVKTSCVLGVLGLSYDRIGAVQRAEKRDAFRYRVGRNRHGQLSDVLDPTVEYDIWREMGACTKPDVEVLFMPAEDDGEVAADDPRVRRAVCALGPAGRGPAPLHARRRPRPRRARRGARRAASREGRARVGRRSEGRDRREGLNRRAPARHPAMRAPTRG